MLAQQAPLNRIGKEIPAVAVNDLGGGRYEIDFGTALTGWMRLKMPPWNSETSVPLELPGNAIADRKEKIVWTFSV